MKSEIDTGKTAQKECRKLGTLEGKASVTFAEDWKMSAEELFSSLDFPLDISSGKTYNEHKERALPQDG